MKNIITPRTLAECSFTTGYPIASLPRYSRADRIRRFTVAAVLFALLSVPLIAWRMA